MTTQSPTKTPPGAANGARLPPLPDPPRKRDMQQTANFERPAVMNTLARFFDALGDDSNVLVSGNGYVCASRSQLPYAPYPDLVIAFDVDRPALVNNNGYEIDQVGKPPDFVLEVASEHTRPPRLHHQTRRICCPGHPRILALRLHRRPVSRRRAGRRPPGQRRVPAH